MRLMRLYLFISDATGVTAMTLDETGASLPPDLGPWRREPGQALPIGGELVGAALSEALARDGYYLASSDPSGDPPAELQLSEDSYRRAEHLAASVLERLHRDDPGIVGIVAALQMASIKVLHNVDPTGAALEAFIGDLRRVSKQLLCQSHTPTSRLQH